MEHQNIEMTGKFTGATASSSIEISVENTNYGKLTLPSDGNTFYVTVDTMSRIDYVSTSGRNPGDEILLMSIDEFTLQFDSPNAPSGFKPISGYNNVMPTITGSGIYLVLSSDGNYWIFPNRLDVGR